MTSRQVYQRRGKRRVQVQAEGQGRQQTIHKRVQAIEQGDQGRQQEFVKHGKGQTW